MKNANYYAVIPAPVLFDKDLTPNFRDIRGGGRITKFFTIK